jgi:hypothetical protein
MDEVFPLASNVMEVHADWIEGASAIGTRSCFLVGQPRNARGDDRRSLSLKGSALIALSGSVGFITYASQHEPSDRLGPMAAAALLAVCCQELFDVLA